MAGNERHGATRAPDVPSVSAIGGWAKFGFVIAVLGVVFGLWSITQAASFIGDVLGFFWDFITGAIALIKAIVADCKSGNGCG